MPVKWTVADTSSYSWHFVNGRHRLDRSQDRATIKLSIHEHPQSWAHEIAHVCLHHLGMHHQYFKDRGYSLSEYEALVWAVAAKFYKKEDWDYKHIIWCVDSYRLKRRDACWNYTNIKYGQHRRCCGDCNRRVKIKIKEVI